MASANHSAGTSRPSLNWVGSSTSKRRNLLRIRRLSLHSEGNVIVGKRRQRRLGNQDLAGLQRLAGEPAEQKSERFLSRGFVWERQDNHGAILRIHGRIESYRIHMPNTTDQFGSALKRNVLPPMIWSDVMVGHTYFSMCSTISSVPL